MGEKVFSKMLNYLKKKIKKMEKIIESDLLYVMFFYWAEKKTWLYTGIINISTDRLSVRAD